MSNNPIPGRIQPPKFKKRLTVVDRTSSNGPWIYAVEHDPNPNCKHLGCNGRGYTGRHLIVRYPIMCRCVGGYNLLHEPGGGGSEDGPPKK